LWLVARAEATGSGPVTFVRTESGTIVSGTDIVASGTASTATVGLQIADGLLRGTKSAEPPTADDHRNLASEQNDRKTFCLMTSSVFGGIFKLAHRRRVLLGIVLIFS
jgi:hypothetical protein